jgi:GxxExxY protein
VNQTAQPRGFKAFDPLTKAIITAAMKVHRALGPGLLEAPYVSCLAHDLRKQSLHVAVQPLLPIRYDDLVIENAYRPDLIVGNDVIVEIKHVRGILAVHEAQLRTYLRLTGLTCGLLLNFNTIVLKNGIRRIDLPRTSFPVFPPS